MAHEDEWSLTRCRGEHDECPHKVLQSVAYRRENGAVVPGIFAVLCRCECHLRCPVGRRADAPDEEWLSSCTCPGSGQRRELEANRQQVLDAAAARRPAYGATPAPSSRYKRGLGPTFSVLPYLLLLTVPAVLAAVAAVGAYSASGSLQVILIVAAVLSAIMSAWVVLKVVAGINLLKNWP